MVDKKLLVEIEGKDKTEPLRRGLKNIQKQMSGVEAISKKLSISQYAAEQGFKQAGISLNKLGISYSNADEFQKKAGMSVNKLANNFNTFGSVMQMDRDLFIGMTKQGYKFSGAGAQIAANIRVATHGLHGFKMEFLSIMFFGMQMQRIGQGILAPAMQLYGVTELFTTVLQVVLLPIMELIYPLLLKVALWLISAPKWFKLLLGGAVVFLTLAGTVMFFGAQLGLFMGSVPGWIGKFSTGIGKMAGAFVHPIKAMKGLFGAFRTVLGNMIISAKAGFGSISNIGTRNADKLSKTTTKTGKKMVTSARTTGKGMLLGGGPILWIIAAIMAAMALLYVAWSKNWGGIRQKTGQFVIWFSGVYDKWIRPVIMYFGTGIILLKNIIGFTLRNIKDIWSFIWLSLKSIAFKAWNAIITGVETFVNAMLWPFRKLSELGSGIIEKIFGFKIPTLPEIDLSKFKSSTTEIDSELTEVKDRLKTGMGDMAKKTVEDINWLDDTLSGLTGTMKNAGEAMIESGDKLDAERAAKEANGEKTSILDGITSKFTNLISGTATPNLDDYTSSIDTNTSTLANAGDEALSTVPKIEDLDNSVGNLDKEFTNTTTTMKDNFQPAMDSQKEILSEVQTAFDNSTYSVNVYTDALKSIPEVVKTTIYKTVITKEKKSGLFGLGFLGLQHGGIVTRPTVAMIAEKGPEAVVPLNKAGNSVGGNVTVYNTYNISGVSSPEDVEKQIEEANSKLMDDLKSMVR